MNYHTSDYIIAYINTFNTEVITLRHTRYYIQHRGDNIMSHKDYIITYINTFYTEVITFNTEVITLCHTSDYIITYVITFNREVPCNIMSPK